MDIIEWGSPDMAMHVDFSCHGKPLREKGEPILPATIVDGSGKDVVTPELKEEFHSFLQGLAESLAAPDTVAPGQEFRDVQYRSKKNPCYKKVLEVQELFLVGDVAMAKCKIYFRHSVLHFVPRGSTSIPVSELRDPERYLIVSWPV